MGCNSCNKVITVRRTCGGDKICISKWLALVLIFVFIGVLCGRCHMVKTCAATQANVTEASTSYSPL